jgi:iron complex transport system ATP-binding protein
VDYSLLLEGVCASYRRTPVLRDLSFTASGGELTALVGLNGSGKTTLLRVLCGVLRPDAGKFRLGGERLDGLPPGSIARRCAYVPQQCAPPPYLTISEALSLCARDSSEPGTADDSTAWARDLLGLSTVANARCDEISGGEWRRVLVAQGLVQLPPRGGLLLLDEPLAFVDAPGRRRLLEMLGNAVIERQAVCLLSIHDLELGAEYCESALHLEAGSLAGSGSYHEVIERSGMSGGKLRHAGEMG